jgi:hypothetical protein
MIAFGTSLIDLVSPESREPESGLNTASGAGKFRASLLGSAGQRERIQPPVESFQEPSEPDPLSHEDLDPRGRCLDRQYYRDAEHRPADECAPGFTATLNDTGDGVRCRRSRLQLRTPCRQSDLRSEQNLLSSGPGKGESRLHRITTYSGSGSDYDQDLHHMAAMNPGTSPATASR